MSTRKGHIPANALKNSISTQLHFLTNINNSCIEQNKFPAIPIFKKKVPLNKKNYSPVRESRKLIRESYRNKSTTFTKTKFSTLCRFRRTISSKHSLIYVLEKRKSTVHKGKYVGEVFLDLSKASGTIIHHLLFAKSMVYGFSHY